MKQSRRVRPNNFRTVIYDFTFDATDGGFGIEKNDELTNLINKKKLK